MKGIFGLVTMIYIFIQSKHDVRKKPIKKQGIINLQLLRFSDLITSCMNKCILRQDWENKADQNYDDCNPHDDGGLFLAYVNQWHALPSLQKNVTSDGSNLTAAAGSGKRVPAPLHKNVGILKDSTPFRAITAHGWLCTVALLKGVPADGIPVPRKRN